MPQKILVAVDDSENAQRAVAFVAKRFATSNPVTLFCVVIDTASLCKMDSPELSPIFKSEQASFCALENKKRELVNAAMKKAKDKLLEAGFPADQVTIKVEDRKHGVARDILAESAQGYDLVVIGRRGISAVKDFFMGSTAQKVFNGAKDISVLIVN